MPRTVTEEHFASIFNGHGKYKMSDAMSTLSDTIDQLEGPMASVTISGQQDGHDGMPKLEVKNADGSESSIHFQVDTMSGEFLPFRPPPLPQADSVTPSHVAGTEVDGHYEFSAPRVYQALFTIEESSEPNGEIRIVAHSPRIVQEEQPRSFLERLAQRQLKLDEARSRRDMHAISVKRQRKLKMKKKKYKKLMKRTRNLRRKLDRT